MGYYCEVLLVFVYLFSFRSYLGSKWSTSITLVCKYVSECSEFLQVVSLMKPNKSLPSLLFPFRKHHHYYTMICRHQLIPSLYGDFLSRFYRALMTSPVPYKSPQYIPGCFTPGTTQSENRSPIALYALAHVNVSTCFQYHLAFTRLHSQLYVLQLCIDHLQQFIVAFP